MATFAQSSNSSAVMVRTSIAKGISQRQENISIMDSNNLLRQLARSGAEATNDVGATTGALLPNGLDELRTVVVDLVDHLADLMGPHLMGGVGDQQLL